MLKNGTYAAWFKTPLSHGTGIVHVLDGKIWGRDGVMTYDGNCTLDGDRFTATVTTRRHIEGLPTVFGDDQELELKLEGTCIDRIGHYVGTAEQFSGVVLEGTLILREPTPEADSDFQTPPFDPARLPKLTRRGRS